MTGIGNESGPGIHGPGAEHTEAGPYTPEQLARWAKQDAFRMEYGIPAVLTGWLVTFILFCVGVTVAAGVISAGDASEWVVLPYTLMFGFPIALIVGLPLALLIAWPLRRVRNQGLHVLAFALGVGAVFGVLGMLSYDAELLWTAALLAGWAAASAAIGRASVIQMVARRN